MTPAAPDHDAPPSARPPCGPVIGRRHGATEVFSGIPYATAERFGTPVAVETWTEPLDATHHGAQCPQLAGALDRLLGDPNIATDEACHHVEVFTPACDDAQRPVLVWVHGGSFVTGGGAMPWYHGASLCELGDVVVVALNYRLGALGFTGTSNCGLHDQVAALRWVATNIEAFGGDPRNVTVFGESAGGSAALALVATPAADDLFVRAWAMSPSITQLRTIERAAEAEDQLLEAAGVAQVEQLRALDLGRLLAAQATLLADPAGAFTAFAPTIDHDLLPGPVLERAISDRRPLVIGTTRDEMNLFTAFDPANAAIDDHTAHERFERVFGSHAGRALGTYRQHRPDTTPGQLVSALQTDEAFRVPAWRLAEARVRTGTPTWMYWFTYATPAFGGRLGSCHGLDIPFAFHNLARPGVEMFTGDGPERTAVADEFAGALLAFAHGDGAGWAGYDLTNRSTRRFDIETTTIDDPEFELRELWDRRDE